MPEFVRGTAEKTVGLGLALSLVAALVVSVGFGYSIAVGSVLAAANFAAIGWLAKKAILDRDHEDSSKRVYTWVALLGVKMGLLLVLAYLAVMLLGVSPIGLALGYTNFVAAIGWQAYVRHTS